MYCIFYVLLYLISFNCFCVVCREKAVKTLVALTTGALPEFVSSNLIEEATLVFKNITRSVLDDEEQFSHCDIQYNYLPQFIIEWITCRAWFLYLTQNVQTSVSMIKDVIDRIQNIIKTKNYPENQ